MPFNQKPEDEQTTNQYSQSLSDPDKASLSNFASTPVKPDMNVDLANLNSQYDVKPGDENVYPNSLRNYAVNALGLPDSWRMSAADEKNYFRNLPAQMGMMGTVGPAAEAGSGIVSLAKGLTSKVTPAAGQAAMEFSPQMTNAIQQMARNPKAPIQVNGAVDGQLFQRLRDYFGHTGPVIFK